MIEIEKKTTQEIYNDEWFKKDKSKVWISEDSCKKTYDTLYELSTKMKDFNHMIIYRSALKDFAMELELLGKWKKEDNEDD